MKDQGEGSGPISIGELSKRTGIAVDTLRVWERRYGEPESSRLPSGHRRYDPRIVRRLRCIADAIAMGHRPGSLFPLSMRELDSIVQPTEAASDKSLDRILLHVRDYRRNAVARELESALTKLGLESWLRTTVAPLLERVGRDWADGKLEVRHEHFLSELLQDILRGVRSRAEAATVRRRRKPSFLFATLPNELHGLGIQMAATLCSARGFQARILGCENPIEELAAAVTEANATVLGISVSLSSAGSNTDKVLRELRERIPEDVTILVGGSGARGPRKAIPGLVYLPRLEELVEYLDDACA